MNKIQQFFKTSFLGGVLVLLPIIILASAFAWLFRFTTNLIQPLSNLIIRNNALPEILADGIVCLLIIALCFTVGTLISTGAGKFVHARFDKYLIRMAPGYKLIKELVNQLLDDKASSPFSNGEVARVKIFGESVSTTVTALVTSRHDNGYFTVFVPTGPNPTSGNMYHLSPEQVELIPHANVSDTMRTIIACGAGSSELFKAG